MRNPTVIYLILVVSLINTSRYIFFFIKDGIDLENLIFLVINIFVVCAIVIDRMKARMKT